MNGHALEYFAAVVVTIIGLIACLPWVGGAFGDSRLKAQRDVELQADRQRELAEAIQAEKDAFAEDLVCAELDLVLADIASASEHFQSVLAEV